MPLRNPTGISPSVRSRRPAPRARRTEPTPADELAHRHRQRQLVRRLRHRSPGAALRVAVLIASSLVVLVLADRMALAAATTPALSPLPDGALALGAGGIGEVTSFAGKLTDYVTAIAASMAVLFIAINGLRWTSSSGNPAKQAEAKNGLTAAIVGLALAVSANLIVTLILTALR